MKISIIFLIKTSLESAIVELTQLYFKASSFETRLIHVSNLNDRHYFPIHLGCSCGLERILEAVSDSIN